jgi:hypothetical protein
MVRKPHVEHDRLRQIAQGGGDALVGGLGDDAVQPELVGEVVEDPPERRVVLDHEEGALIGVEPVPVVDDRRRPERPGAGAARALGGRFGRPKG